MRALLLLVMLSGCGRISFDPRQDAGGDAMPDAFTCPAGYTFEAATGSCYRGSNAPLSWLAAEAACEADGAHLVAIADATEAAVADRYRGSPTDFAWIGGTDLVTEGLYVSVFNESATYVVFAANEPEGAMEDCLLLVANLQVADGTCTFPDDYICEYDGRRGASPAWGVCPPGYTFVGAGCYRAQVGFAGDHTWLAAEALCEADGVGAHLAVITSSEEAADAQTLAPPQSILAYWIGTTDAVTEGVFTTVTNTAATYLPWTGGEPSGGTTQNCVLSTMGATYTDESCANGHNVMCEYDAIPAVPAAWGQ